MSEKKERREPPMRYQHRRAFIVCRSALKEEEDTITDAAVYFYPKFEELEKSYVAVRCKQLVGVPEVLQDIGLGCPTIFNFGKGFTAIRAWGDYFVYLEGRYEETQEEVERVLDKMCESFIHMRGSFGMFKRSDPAEFNKDMKTIWDQILNYYFAMLEPNDRMFDQFQTCDLRKKERNVCLLQAKQMIDHFVQYRDVITGAVFYHNKILYCDSLLQDAYPSLLDNFAILADLSDSECLPLKEIQLGDLLNNCSLYVFYLYKNRWCELGGRDQVSVSSDDEVISIRDETSLMAQSQRISHSRANRESAKTISSLSEDMGTRLGLKSVCTGGFDDLATPITTPSHETSHGVEESVTTDIREEEINLAIGSLQPLTRSGESVVRDVTALPFSPAESLGTLSERDPGVVESKLSQRHRFNSLPSLVSEFSEEMLDGSPVEELEVGDNPLKDDKYSTMKLATLNVRKEWFNPPQSVDEVEHEPWLTEVCILVVSVNKLRLFLVAERTIYKDIPLLLEIREASVTSLNRLNAYVHNCILNPNAGLSCKLLTFVSHDSYDNKLVASKELGIGDQVFKNNVRQVQREFQKFPELKAGSFTCRKNGFIAKKNQITSLYYQGTKQLQKLFAEKSIPHVDALVFVESEGYGMMPNHPRLFNPKTH